MFKRLIRLSLLTGFFVMTLNVFADYPDRQITLVVPYTPGGFTDNLARAVAKPLGVRLKRLVVNNNVKIIKILNKIYFSFVSVFSINNIIKPNTANELPK